MTAGSSPAVRWRRWRWICQAAVGLFFLLLPVAASLGFQGVAGTLAALRLGAVDLVEPAAALSAVLAARRLALVLALGVLPPLLLALALGPVFCSWVCPWGLVSEGLDGLRQGWRRWRGPRGGRRGRQGARAGGRGRSWPASATRGPRWWRLGLFAGLMLLSALLASPLAALLSGPRLATALPLELVYLHLLSPVTGGLLLGLLALELVGPRRLWCRTLCPAGTAAKLLRQPRTLTMRFLPERCTCPAVPLCQAACAWGIDPRRMETLDGCTNCFACVEGCPSGSLVPCFTGRGPRLAQRAELRSPLTPGRRQAPPLQEKVNGTGPADWKVASVAAGAPGTSGGASSPGRGGARLLPGGGLRFSERTGLVGGKSPGRGGARLLPGGGPPSRAHGGREASTRSQRP